MTRKHYELIAGVFAAHGASNEYMTPEAKAEIQALAIRMAAALRDTNPRFDAERFISACRLS